MLYVQWNNMHEENPCICVDLFVTKEQEEKKGKIELKKKKINKKN